MDNTCPPNFYFIQNIFEFNRSLSNTWRRCIVYQSGGEALIVPKERMLLKSLIFKGKAEIDGMFFS